MTAALKLHPQTIGRQALKPGFFLCNKLLEMSTLQHDWVGLVMTDPTPAAGLPANCRDSLESYFPCS
jgi:hypothetical protein